MSTACPICDRPLTTQPDAKPLGRTADSYTDCARICAACGIGLSNAADRPTFIRADWLDGLWRRGTGPRLLRIIERSLSDASRQKKIGRLAHERSEDLLTWNVFSWLEDRGLLASLLSAILGRPCVGDVRIFYWGANDHYDLEVDLRPLLRDTFKESPAALSEPDVILLGPSSVVFVEAKFGSTNDRQPGRAMDNHLTPVPGWFTAGAGVAKAGFYELTRNWAIGALLSEKLSKDFTLVNLVREEEEGDIETAFGRLVTTRGLFKRLTWERLVRTIEPALAAHLREQTIYFQPAFQSLSPRP